MLGMLLVRLSAQEKGKRYSRGNIDNIFVLLFLTAGQQCVEQKVKRNR